MRYVLLLLCSFAAFACGESDKAPNQPHGSGGSGGGGAGGTGGAGSDGGLGGTGGGSVLAPVEWEECEGPGVCATIEVPLDWDDPAGERIDFFVRRIPTPAATSKGQLWLLQGGPGSAGWAFAEYPTYFQQLAPGYDLYIPDYRGVGYSTWLGCEGQAGDEIRATCRTSLLQRWGDDLRHFSTTGGALDIGHTIDRIRQPGERVYVYGTSYGTFMANRYLSLFPDQADGAVLDSVCPAQGCDVRMDHNFNRVAEHVFGLCGDDAFCSGKLGPDPFARVASLMSSLEAGHCEELYGYPSNQFMLRTAVVYTMTQPETAALAAATIYRAERCNSQDVDALKRLMESLFGVSSNFAAAGSDESSNYLMNNVIFSEFWPEGLDRALAERELAELPIQTGSLMDRVMAKERWTWKLYSTPDALMNWAPTEIPLLLMNGDLDGQTHLTGLLDVEASLRNETQHFVEVPFGGHSLIFSSPASPKNRRITCGVELVSNFFADPQGALDSSCARASNRIDFRGYPALARSLFGTDDLWENPVAPRLAQPPPFTESQARAVEQLRRRAKSPLGF